MLFSTIPPLNACFFIFDKNFGPIFAQNPKNFQKFLRNCKIIVNFKNFEKIENYSLKSLLLPVLPASPFSRGTFRPEPHAEIKL